MFFPQDESPSFTHTNTVIGSMVSVVVFWVAIVDLKVSTNVSEKQTASSGKTAASKPRRPSMTSLP
jgi:hypothetical protein